MHNGMWRNVLVSALTVTAQSAFAEEAAPAAAPPPAAAAPAPAAASAEDINRVMDHLNLGKDVGPVLLETTPCLKVDLKPGEKIRTCVDKVSGPVKKKTLLHLWTRWMVPKGGKYEDLSVQFLLGGEPRETKDLTLESEHGTLSTGAYKSLTLTKAGAWEMRVRRGDKVLGTATVTVED